MKLNRRQSEFRSKLMDMYYQVGRDLHAPLRVRLDYQRKPAPRMLAQLRSLDDTPLGFPEPYRLNQGFPVERIRKHIEHAINLESLMS